MTNEKELLRGWYQAQSDPCMCLGDCEKCNFHACHGCLCWIEKIVAEATRIGKAEAWSEAKQMANDASELCITANILPPLEEARRSGAADGIQAAMRKLARKIDAKLTSLKTP